LLREALTPLGDVQTVAPERDSSGVARSITIGRPLRLRHVRFADGAAAVAIDGTPVDCVRVALLGVLGPRPDLIVSGVNFGGNMGNDATYSGTVGAALEAALHGLPGVAVSVETREPAHLGEARALLTGLMERVLLAPLSQGLVLNINLPDRPLAAMAGIKVTALGGSSCHDKLVLCGDDGVRGEYRIVCARRPLEPQVTADFEAVAHGYVSLTPLHYGLTSGEGLAMLAGWPLADLLAAASRAVG
jgi:5'-nucleotidase